MAEQTITIRTKTELSALRQLEDRLEKEIVQARVLGKEFGHLEQQLGKVRAGIQAMPPAAKIGAGAATGDGRSMFGGMRDIVTGAGAAFVAGRARRAIEETANIKDLAETTEIATDTIQAFREQASLAAGGITQVDKAFEKLTDQIGEARKGNKQAIATFAELGISVDDLNRKTNNEIFMQLHDALSEVPDISDKARLAVDLFGEKVGIKLVSSFQGGSESIRKMTEDMRRMGRLITEEEIAKLDRYDAQLKKLQSTLNVSIARGLSWLGSAVEDAAAFWGASTASGLASKGLVEDINAGMAAMMDNQQAITNQIAAEKAAREGVRNVQGQIIKQTQEEIDLRKKLADEEKAAFEAMQRGVEQNVERGKFKSVDEIISAGEKGKLQTPQQRLELEQAKLAKSYENIAEENRGVDPAKSSRYFRAAEVVRGRIGSLAESAGGGKMPLTDTSKAQQDEAVKVAAQKQAESASKAAEATVKAMEVGKASHEQQISTLMAMYAQTGELIRRLEAIEKNIKLRP